MFQKMLVSCAFVAALITGAQADTLSGSYDWEDGNGTLLGSYGNLATAENVSDFSNGGTNSVYLVEDPISGTPQAYVAWITGLTDGDMITASFWNFHDLETTCRFRIWGHYSDSEDVTSYNGSASGNSTYSDGSGWNMVEHTWTFDSSGGTRSGLVVEARMYSSTTNAPGNFGWVDDVQVEVNGVDLSGTEIHTPGDFADDSDGDGVPNSSDNCPDTPNPDQLDCDNDGIGDACTPDCNANGIPDPCEALPDCNANGVPDGCDIDFGVSQDCNANGIPDECDLEDGTLHDDNGNGVPDECEVVPPTGLAIMEIRGEQAGADTDEYFELSGDPGTSLQGLRYIVIGDTDEGGSGVIECIVDLNGLVIGFDGLFLCVEDTFTLGSLGNVDLLLSGANNELNFEGSDNVTHVLVANFSGSNGQDLDIDDDGVLDDIPWTDTLAAVSMIETEEDPPTDTEHAYADELGGETVGPDESYLPGHIWRCNDTGVWNIGTFALDDPEIMDTPGIENPDCDPGNNCPEDVDDDGSIGFSDLLAVLSFWGSSGGAEDVDGDGTVGFSDLLAILSQWGDCTP